MSSNNDLISCQELYDIMKSSRCETIYEQYNFIKKRKLKTSKKL